MRSSNNKSISFVMLIVILILGAFIQTIMAQEDGVNLVQTAEYDIGFTCPQAATLDSTGTIIWMLMDNCFQRGYSLNAFNIADGTQVNTNDYADSLESLASISIDHFSVPMGIAPTGEISIRYTDYDTSASFNLLIALDSGEATTETSPSYDELLASLSEYPEYVVYSKDHTQVVVAGTTSYYVIDVQAETQIAEIPVDGGADSAIPYFSADGAQLHLVQYNVEDMEDFDSTLLVYSLPDGTLLQQHDVPSTSVWLSPDGAYVAVHIYSNDSEVSQLAVMDTATGDMSTILNLREDPSKVMTCLNTGNDMSDVDFTATGRFSYPDFYWLPDSSGLVIPLSYNGEGAGGGTPCIFNYSRLRTYTVDS